MTMQKYKKNQYRGYVNAKNREIAKKNPSPTPFLTQCSVDLPNVYMQLLADKAAFMTLFVAIDLPRGTNKKTPTTRVGAPKLDDE